MAHPLDLAHLGQLIGDPARARMLSRLLDGRALTANELATVARVTPQTVSSHLRKLQQGGLIRIEPRGRHRYVMLAGSAAAQALEALGVLVAALPGPTRTPVELRFARLCYDHLAGRLAVDLVRGLESKGMLAVRSDGWRLSATGVQWLQRITEHDGMPELHGRRCMDWSERQDVYQTTVAGACHRFTRPAAERQWSSGLRPRHWPALGLSRSSLSVCDEQAVSLHATNGLVQRGRRLLPGMLLLSAAVMLSRLVWLRGAEPVFKAAGQVMGWALWAWLGHVMLHEAAHAMAAVACDFSVRGLQLGPFRLARDSAECWRLSLSGRIGGGAITTWPRTPHALRRRIRLVAGAGPLATLFANGIALSLAHQQGLIRWASPSGIAAAIGFVLLVSALVPGPLHPGAPDGGTDGDQLLMTRRTHAFWTHAALLEGLRQRSVEGLSEIVSETTLREFLPPLNSPAEPVESSWAVCACESGDFTAVKARLDARLAQAPSGPDWLWGDFTLIRALLAALIEHDRPRALALRPHVVAHQGFEWFVCLLDAATAETPETRAAALAEWQSGAQASEVQRYALPAARWALNRIV